jgi:hypothetical protein
MTHPDHLACIRRVLGRPRHGETQGDAFACLLNLSFGKIYQACCGLSLSDEEAISTAFLVVVRLRHNNYNNLRAFLLWQARESLDPSSAGERTFDEWLRRLCRDEANHQLRRSKPEASAAGGAGEPFDRDRDRAPKRSATLAGAEPTHWRPPGLGLASNALDEQQWAALTVFWASKAHGEGQSAKKRAYEEVAKALGLTSAESTRAMARLAHQWLGRLVRNPALLGGAG